ncbi:adenosylcobinamide-GDP ribazoletransferase, partial [Clostridioides difficile]|uniref:adenosylcobinamide-GDP ribazoletransferase n=1 Tax=Clostridioides difficile TaxID=1496 RepID=UPI003F8D0CCD
ITGGLHIDGLGDTFDAIYSYRDKEKMLEIMKDSRLGTNSLLAIMFVLLLKIGFVYSIISNNSLWVIIFMPMIARLGVMLLTYKTVTPRAKGMGNLFIGKLTTNMLVTAIIYTILIVSIIAKLIFLVPNIVLIKVLCSAIVVFIFILLFKNHIYKKIDGVTGDVLGCGIELSELVYLIYIYLLIFMFI